MLYIGLFAVLLYIGEAHIPSLNEVIDSIAFPLPMNTSYARLWAELQGDALTASAVSTRNLDHIQAAMLLAGHVMSNGVSLSVQTNGLSALCEMVISGKDVFFSESVFEKNKQTFITIRRESGIDQNFRLYHEMEVFPFMDLVYVCGGVRMVPLAVKVALIKARSLCRTINYENNFGGFSLNEHPTFMNTSFNELVQEFGEQGISRLLFDMNHEVFSLFSTLLSKWLHKVIVEMLTASEYFRVNEEIDVLELVLLYNPHMQVGYYVIGQLFGLAIKNNVTFPMPLEGRLLSSMVLSPRDQETALLPPHIHRIRTGFYSIISMEAIAGYYTTNPRKIINKEELGNILRGNY